MVRKGSVSFAYGLTYNSLYYNEIFYFSENVPLSGFLFISLLIYNLLQATKDLR